MTKTKTKKAWAGIIENKGEDKIDITKELYNQNDILAIYPTKKLAKKFYQKVVPVEINLCPKQKQK